MSLRSDATLGVLGGGQLGRMLAIAAYRLGLKVHIYAESPDEPALEVTARSTVAPFTDETALDAFADAVDVVTLEFENVPTATLERLATRVPVRPGARVLGVTQDRLHEKMVAREAGFATAPFVAVEGAGSVAAASLAFPARLKTRRFGYDGRGQVGVSTPADVPAAMAALGNVPALLESEVAFERELSVLVARRPSGQTVCFPPVENRHVDGILAETLAPAPISLELAAEATRIAMALADELALEGLLAVELFATASGELLVNELAPRPHNSGHWTLEGCLPDQFEQAVRAVCDWPLGEPRVLGSCRMTNLLGKAVLDAPRWLEMPATRLHLYGKSAWRSGRKMGHATSMEGAT